MVPLAERRDFGAAQNTAEKGRLSGACGMAAGEPQRSVAVAVAVVAEVETRKDSVERVVVAAQPVEAM